MKTSVIFGSAWRMKAVMKTECIRWHQRGNMASCPSPWKLPVQENNTGLVILSLGIRRTPQLEEHGLLATARVGHAGLEDSHQPPEVKEKTMGSRAESSPPSPGAMYTQPFCTALTHLHFSSFPLASNTLEQRNCLCLAQLTTVLIALQSPPWDSPRWWLLDCSKLI